MKFTAAVRMGVVVLGIGSLVVLSGCRGGQQRKQDAAMTENEELRERIAALETQVQGKDTQISELSSRVAAAEARAAATPAPTAGGNTWDSGGAGFSGGGVRASVEPAGIFRASDTGGVVATVGGDIFSPGSATINRSAHDELNRIAADIQRHYSGMSVRVEGHTDRTPINRSRSRWRSNEHLSEARADAVRDYLVRRGVASGLIETVGMGASRPKSTNAASRRIEVHIGG